MGQGDGLLPPYPLKLGLACFLLFSQIVQSLPDFIFAVLNVKAIS